MSSGKGVSECGMIDVWYAVGCGVMLWQGVTSRVGEYGVIVIVVGILYCFLERWCGRVIKV